MEWLKETALKLIAIPIPTRGCKFLMECSQEIKTEKRNRIHLWQHLSSKLKSVKRQIREIKVNTISRICCQWIAT
jgi:hypothetical protein